MIRNGERVGVAVSVVAATISVGSCVVTKNIADYQTLVANESIYSEAVTSFGGFLRSPHLYDLFGPAPAETITKANDAQLIELSRKTDALVAPYNDFTARVNRARTGWPEDTDNALMDSGTKARVAVGCYLTLQRLRFDNRGPGSLDRAALISMCRNEEGLRNAFEEQYRKAQVLMSRDIEAAK